MKLFLSERGLYTLIPKTAKPIICLGTAARMRGWTSVWTGDIKVFVEKEIPVTTGIIPYIVDTHIEYEIYKGLPVTSEFQTIADLVTWWAQTKIDSQIPVESFAVLFESDNVYPIEDEMEIYINKHKLTSIYRKLREECKSFYDY